MSDEGLGLLGGRCDLEAQWRWNDYLRLKWAKIFPRMSITDNTVMKLITLLHFESHKKNDDGIRILASDITLTFVFYMIYLNNINTLLMKLFQHQVVQKQ